MARFDIAPGAYEVGDARFAIAVARFNRDICDALLAGALDTFGEHGVPAARVTVVRVPGAFELPLAAERLLRHRDYAAVVALGAVIRGETPHFDYVSGECARGIARVSLDSGVPVIFGVLTTDDHAQALARAGGEVGNKGSEAALAALEMATLLRAMAP